MRYILFLLPLLSWGVLPQLEMNQIVRQYHDINQSSILTYVYNNKNYYIVLSVEEKLFSDETLEEEKEYLKVGVKQILFSHMKKKYPKMSSLAVSGLLHGTFWEDENFYHHISQVNKKLVKPIFTTDAVHPATISLAENNISLQGEKLNNKILSDSSIQSDTHKATENKIKRLESQSKKYPFNLKLLQELSTLYKETGDIEGYASVTNRIIDVKMNP